jgi:hypothetical protein
MAGCFDRKTARARDVRRPPLPRSRIDHKNVKIPISNQPLNLFFCHLFRSELSENRSELKENRHHQLSIFIEF